MPVYALNGVSPNLPNDGWFWIAPGAQVIGKVRLETGVSIWFGAVLRGDIEEIFVGARSNVQDGSLLHTDMGIPVDHRSGLHDRTPRDPAWLHDWRKQPRRDGRDAFERRQNRPQLFRRRQCLGDRRQAISGQQFDRRQPGPPRARPR